MTLLLPPTVVSVPRGCVHPLPLPLLLLSLPSGLATYPPSRTLSSIVVFTSHLRPQLRSHPRLCRPPFIYLRSRSTASANSLQRRYSKPWFPPCPVALQGLNTIRIMNTVQEPLACAPRAGHMLAFLVADSQRQVWRSTRIEWRHHDTRRKRHRSSYAKRCSMG